MGTVVVGGIAERVILDPGCLSDGGRGGRWTDSRPAWILIVRWPYGDAHMLWPWPPSPHKPL